MQNYFVLRYLTPIGLMIGWVLYQLVIKRKKWASVQDDALACFVFACVWIAIAYMIAS